MAFHGSLDGGEHNLLALLIFAIKFTIRRRRPEGDWGAVYRNTDPHSFHPACRAHFHVGSDCAQSGAAMVSGWCWLFGHCSSALPALWMGVHYLSDVIAGFILGLVRVTWQLPSCRG